ncbi:AMP-binding protein [Halocalculus aciditolerans]|uniref:acetate--CoA ligase n=1 Tax=Halocalculus aciditolerans TaxID=1383812 RepID=A0A830F4C2_9EURY|nr:AMP-binding protein [Halocalculus aciditolerans]GGL62155.1 acetyl-CoA synthetase [Halocalculus aciditolerans]
MDSLADVDEIAHRPSREFVESTNVWRFMQAHDIDDYDELIERTTGNLEWFWGELPHYLGLDFFEGYDAVRDDSDGPQFTDWYVGAELNVAHNTVDRYAERGRETRNKTACVWEGEPGETRELTYHELARQSNQVANALVERGIEEGDTVALYMPMVPEVVSILYGVFKVGAIAVPIFSGFGTDATATRLDESEARVLFTGDGFYRRGGEVTLKETADEAVEETGHVESTIVFDRLGHVPDDGEDADDAGIPWDDARDESWTEAVETRDDDFETRAMDANDPCMLLYSSGTTGKPKGIVHSHAGALVQPAKEIHFGFDQKPADRFFWVSDIGWMMGPWTLIGNHAFGGTVVMYEGAPDHPEPDRFWSMIDRHDVTQFGVSPTAVRALRKYGDEHVEKHDLSSIRLLGSTGEPWDPESWHWFYEHVGNGEAPIINISGGTEIVGCFLMPMPIQDLKPCTLGGPGLGMDIDIVDSQGGSVADAGERGLLVARDSCPSMTRSLWEGDDRYLDTYWSAFTNPPLWNHGDWAQRDDDGFWFLHGRADDAINVAGRKVGPAEVEGALMDHDAVNQAAAVGVPDDTTGEAVVAYVILEPGYEESDELAGELRAQVGDELGKPFRPREIRFVEEFPKTQSGKIIRRAIEGAYTGEDIGDLSSIENPEALEALRED